MRDYTTSIVRYKLKHAVLGALTWAIFVVICWWLLANTSFPEVKEFGPYRALFLGASLGFWIGVLQPDPNRPKKKKKKKTE